MSEGNKVISFVAVCIVVMITGLFLLRGREAPAVVTRERLAVLQVAVEEWAAAHDGSPPQTLEALGLPDDAIRDHAGTVFNYRIDENDGSVTIISYGADGRPGGFMFRADTETTFKVGSQERN